MLHFTSPTMRRQRGALLLEVLVAFLVLSLGMLTLARMQTHLRLDSDLASQRSEAVRLAQREIEALRTFTVLDKSTGPMSYESIDNRSRTIDPTPDTGASTRFTIDSRVDSSAIAHAKAVTVGVQWFDRHNDAQQVNLSSIISRSDPAYGGAFSLMRSSRGVPTGALGRSMLIPVDAKDLGDGRSAIKPAGGSPAFIFDNRTGLVVVRCVNVGAKTSDLTAANLNGCNAVNGLLLSGFIRFASPSSSDRSQAKPVPLTAAVSLALTGGVYAMQPDCSVDPQAPAAGSTDSEADHIAYRCVVYPLANGTWSGRANLVPAGWNIGVSATDHRVCRYVTDVDGSGSIDANIEHPANYTAVNTSLAQQNYLVIAGPETCPGDTTAQHQP
jgi:hypothetical protein